MGKMHIVWMCITRQINQLQKTILYPANFLNLTFH